LKNVFNIILIFTALTLNARVTGDDLGQGSDGAGGAFLFGLVLIIGAFNYFRDSDSIFGAASAYLHILIFFIGLFLVGVRTSDIGIPATVVFGLAVYFFPKKKHTEELNLISPREQASESNYAFDRTNKKSTSTYLDKDIGLDKKIHRHPILHDWYKNNVGIGNKNSCEFYLKKDYLYSFEDPIGYWINLNKTDAKPLFVFHKDVEIVGIDAVKNKFLTKCPKCKVACLGDIFEWVRIKCPKCNHEWEQKIN